MKSKNINVSNKVSSDNRATRSENKGNVNKDAPRSGVRSNMKRYEKSVAVEGKRAVMPEKKPTANIQRMKEQQKSSPSFIHGKKVGYDSDEKARLHQKQFEVTCKRLDFEGRGLVEIQKRWIPVPNLLPGEEALVEVRVHRSTIEGTIIEKKSNSSMRVKSKCRVFGVCGGCQLHHISYQDQIAWKEDVITEYFSQYQGYKGVRLPLIASEEPLHYRHKNQMVFGMGKKNKIISGFYEEDSHRIVQYDDCLIQHPKANAISKTCRELMVKHKLMPYDEDAKTGLIRHVFIRCGYATKELLVAIVTASEIFPGRKNFIQDLRQLHPEITSIVQVINDRNTNMVLSDKQRILHGNGYIEDVLCGVRFQISTQSFFQVNPQQTQKLFQAAIEAADLQGDEIVFDAYCGIGTIGLIASKNAKNVIGVEQNKQAFQDAIRNAKMNNIKNATFINADASDFMVEMANRKEHVDVLFMDPPRSGSDQKFIDSLAVLKPKKIVYVSCNVETQVRDIRDIAKLGYELKSIQGVDLFPYTKHVETVVLMSRVDK